MSSIKRSQRQGLYISHTDIQNGTSKYWSEEAKEEVVRTEMLFLLDSERQVSFGPDGAHLNFFTLLEFFKAQLLI
jgi:hypothetical protein